jgi:ankyrin repeat protein
MKSRNMRYYLLFLTLFSFHISATQPSAVDNLLIAVKRDNLTEVKEILAKSQKLLAYRDRSGRNLLMYAINSDSIAVTKYLIQLKVLTNGKDDSGRNPLHVALSNNPLNPEPVTPKRLEIIQLPIDAGVSVQALDRDESSVLHYAAESEEPKVLELILKAGAKVNEFRRDSVLHSAARRGLVKNVDILIQNGAKIDAYDQYFGFSPLHAVLHDVNTTNISKFKPVIERLLQKGADPNLVCRIEPVPFYSDAFRGYTALHLAVRANIPEIVKLLLHYKATKTAKSVSGKLAIDLAKNEEIKALLLK